MHLCLDHSLDALVLLESLFQLGIRSVPEQHRAVAVGRGHITTVWAEASFGPIYARSVGFVAVCACENQVAEHHKQTKATMREHKRKRFKKKKKKKAPTLTRAC